MHLHFSWQLAAFSFGTGVVLGVVFSFLRFPIPAPAIIEGALGVVGTTVGGVILGPWLRDLVLRIFNRG